jgi:hypothetical protein
MAFVLAGCSLAGDITPPPALATAQAAETLPPATVAPTETAETPAIPSPTVSGTAFPAEPGTIRGVVTNGTPGGLVPGGIEVLLSGFDEDQETYQQSTTVADDGTYVFTDVPAVEGRIYGVTVAYGAVLYYSEGEYLTEDGTAPDLSVTVYETTTDTAALSIERLHVLFDFSVADQVQVIELWVVSNLGDRTIVAAPSRGIIEVSLPLRRQPHLPAALGSSDQCRRRPASADRRDGAGRGTAGSRHAADERAGGPRVRGRGVPCRADARDRAHGAAAGSII